MSRRLAIILAVLAVVVFGVVYFWPEDAGAGDVSGRLHLGDRGVQARGSIGGLHVGGSFGGVRLRGSFGGVRWSDGLDRRHHGHRHGKHRDRRHHRAHGLLDRSIVIVPDVQTERVIERETVVISAPPPPAQFAPVPQPAPPTALDPQGQARTVPARGVGQPREWVLGAVLPPDLPVVLLDPAAYGLPQPPDGQIYIRVDGDVLRIQADTRRIVSVLAG